jgi:hypothetical protein
VCFVSESDYRGSKSSFIHIYLSSNIPNSSDVVILFRLMKKIVISANLFTPEQKLTFNCVLCGWLGNQFSGTKKQFYSDLSVFQFSKFLGGCDFISFDEKNFYISQFIYSQTKTHVELHFLWLVSESDFRGLKSCFIRIFPPSNIPNS